MLHDSRRAVAIVTVAPPPHAPPSAFVMTALLCGSVRVAGVRERRVGGEPVLEGGRRDDELEGRSGRVQVAGDRAVDQRVVGVGEQRVVRAT